MTKVTGLRALLRMKKLIGTVLTAVGLGVWLTAPGRGSRRAEAPFLFRTFAHRGLYTEDGSIPENSLAAFEAACQNGYGMELDVQLSRDGAVVVFHDDDLARVCGVPQKVGDLTLEELKELSLNGTKERIPLFSEVLATVDGRGPLIIELKPTRRRQELCEKTVALLKDYEGDYCVESFDPLLVGWFRLHEPEILRGQLAMPPMYRKREKGAGPVEAGKVFLHNIIQFLAGNCLANFYSRPQFIAYQLGPCPITVKLAYGLGVMKVGWTSRQPGEEKGMDALIFEFYRPEKRFR